MIRKSLLLGGSSLLVLMGLAAVLWAMRLSDPCLSGIGDREHVQLQSKNYLLFSCDGKIYFGDTDPKSYRKASVDVASFKALPFRFGRDKDRFYYVVRGSDMWGHNELRILPGVDVDTVEVLADGLVRDQVQIYRVLDEQFFVEKREY